MLEDTGSCMHQGRGQIYIYIFFSDRDNKDAIFFCLAVLLADPFVIVESAKIGIPQVLRKLTVRRASTWLCHHITPWDLEDMRN